MLFCGLLFAQVSLEQANHQAVEVLTDTRGVDFTRYLAKVKSRVRELVRPDPASCERERGKVVLEFFVLKDGSVAGLKDRTVFQPAYVGSACLR